MTNMTGRLAERTVEENGGSTASYLARTPCVALLILIKGRQTGGVSDLDLSFLFCEAVGLIGQRVGTSPDSHWPDEMVVPAELESSAIIPCLNITHSLLTQKTLSLHTR